eukprot:1161615-Pelagomonas_calceolata.AAC.13
MACILPVPLSISFMDANLLKTVCGECTFTCGSRGVVTCELTYELMYEFFIRELTGHRHCTAYKKEWKDNAGQIRLRMPRASLQGTITARLALFTMNCASSATQRLLSCYKKRFLSHIACSPCYGKCFINRSTLSCNVASAQHRHCTTCSPCYEKCSLSHTAFAFLAMKSASSTVARCLAAWPLHGTITGQLALLAMESASSNAARCLAMWPLHGTITAHLLLCMPRSSRFQGTDFLLQRGNDHCAACSP